MVYASETHPKALPDVYNTKNLDETHQGWCFDFASRRRSYLGAEYVKMPCIHICFNFFTCFTQWNRMNLTHMPPLQN